MAENNQEHVTLLQELNENESQLANDSNNENLLYNCCDLSSRLGILCHNDKFIFNAFNYAKRLNNIFQRTHDITGIILSIRREYLQYLNASISFLQELYTISPDYKLFLIIRQYENLINAIDNECKLFNE